MDVTNEKLAHRPEKVLPDISHEEQASIEGRLDQVGMDAIEMPVRLTRGDESFLLPAKVDVKVSLDKANAKGIHMSRLYKVLNDSLNCKSSGGTTSEKSGETGFKFAHIKQTLDALVESQQGLSQNAFVRISFDLPIERKALLSEEAGWRQYPVFIEARRLKENYEISIGGQVLYSSTCPCSAALSRQLVKEKFAEDFENMGDINVETVLDWLGQKSSIVATPHAQRSVADFRVLLKEGVIAPSFEQMIDLVEAALGTPVQSAVKRQDEQEFARLNATQLMFCEDAARKLKSAFETDQRFAHYVLRVEHQESLHPHNAVSLVSKES